MMRQRSRDVQLPIEVRVQEAMKELQGENYTNEVYAMVQMQNAFEKHGFQVDENIGDHSQLEHAQVSCTVDDEEVVFDVYIENDNGTLIVREISYKL